MRADPQLLAAVQRVRQAGDAAGGGAACLRVWRRVRRAGFRMIARVAVAGRVVGPGGPLGRVVGPGGGSPGPGGRSRAATQGRGDAGAGEVRGLCRAKEALSTWESAAEYLAHSPGSRRTQERS